MLTGTSEMKFALFMVFLKYFDMIMVVKLLVKISRAWKVIMFRKSFTMQNTMRWWIILKELLDRL